MLISTFFCIKKLIGRSTIFRHIAVFLIQPLNNQQKKRRMKAVLVVIKLVCSFYHYAAYFSRKSVTAMGAALPVFMVNIAELGRVELCLPFQH